MPLWCAGCGGSDDQPITSQTSKFQVAGDDDKAGGAPGAGAPAAEGTPGDQADARSALPKPPSRPPLAANSGRDPASGAEDGQVASKGGPSTKQGARRVTPETIPDGTPDELIALLDEVEQDGPRGRNNREMLDSLRQWLKTRLAIVDKVLAAEGPAATDKHRVRAAQAKREVLIQMIKAGLPDVDKQMNAFCESLKTDRSPALVRIGRLTDLQLNLAMVMSGAKEDTEGFEAAFQSALEIEPADDEVFQSAVAAAVTMQQAGKNDVALAAYQAIQTKFADSSNDRIKTILGQLNELAKFIEVKFDPLFKAVIANEPEADVQLVAAVSKLLENKPGPAVFERLSQAAQELEANRRYELAGGIFESLATAFKDHPDVEVAKEAENQVASGRRRAKLIGQPIVVEGKRVDGKEFDWKDYEGKIVLIDFWATWCEPCRREMPNIKRNLDKFRDQGFEVVGVNLDQDQADVDQFFSVQALPWVNVVDAKELADKCGVESIPFVMLVGRDGRVIDLHVRGDLLGQRLEEIFDEEAKAGGAPASTGAPKTPEAKPAAAAEKPAAEKPAETKPGVKDESRFVPSTRQGTGFVAADEPATPEPRRAPGTGRRVTTGAGDKPAAKQAGDGEPGEAKPKGDEPEVNPYLARPTLKPAELVEFLLNMQEKPKSIQGRQGFTEAIVDAADRLLAAADTSDKFRGIAAAAKIEALHKKASSGDKQADEQLNKFVDSLQEKPIAAVADTVKFLLLERLVAQANDLPLEKVPELLEQVKQFCTAEKLEARHLRLASSTVEAINRLEDGDVREKQFAEFGKLFAKSSDKELARYGKKLAKAPAGKESDLVGKPLELAGATASGAPFDWATYRGKVVIVDFWATWCGPCVRELPNVKAVYEKHKDRGFDILGISLDQDQEALADFLQKNQIPWQTLAGDGTQEIAQKYGVRGIPTVMLIDREGKVLGVAHRIDQLLPELEKQLNGK